MATKDEEMNIGSSSGTADKGGEKSFVGGAGGKVKSKVGVNKLLEEAFRYSSKYEYSLPNSFLRERKKKDSSEITSEDTFSKGKSSNAAKVVANSTKLLDATKSKIHATKIVNKKRSRAKGKTIIRESLEFDSDLSCIEPATSTPSPKSLTPSKCSSAELMTPIEKSNAIESQFTNPALPEFELQYQFFDTDFLPSQTVFDQEIIESASVTSKYFENGEAAFSTSNTVKLKYPLFDKFQETYQIDFDAHVFDVIYNPMSEIGTMIENTMAVYIPEKYKARFQTDVIKPLNEAFDNRKKQEFIAIVETYNKLLSQVPRDEIIQQLRSTKKLPNKFICDLLQIVYSRCVHPEAKKLSKYTAFSSFVYGELLPSFLTEVFVKCNLKPGQIFMDLGSGVGNCVIQAALEYGCEVSFGCEIMKSASDLTELQHKELKARCKLMGIKLSNIEFSLRKSFVDNERVTELLKKCDVLLLNNFLFDAELNNEVQKVVQNCKPGCKIISLKSLRPLTYTINFDDVENILNRLKVSKFDLKENSVSWTHRGGEYFISEVQLDLDDSLFSTTAGHRRKKRLRYSK